MLNISKHHLIIIIFCAFGSTDQITPPRLELASHDKKEVRISNHQMAPQWMPQNIQKRLLRYVLQQLSVFSELDLPNLEVSLGTNSKAALHNVQLDTDKINIPGFQVTQGQVKNLELNLGVSDGVFINCDGIEITMEPHFNNSEASSFSLAKSTAELANSVVEPEEEIPPTAMMGGVMARAVELALSRLHIELTNVKISLPDFEVLVEAVSVSSTNGVRNVSFKELRVISHCEEDSESDSGYESMDSSLQETQTFSRYEARSLYMSATSKLLAVDENCVFHVNHGEISFEGLQSIVALDVSIGEVKVSSCGIIAPLESVLESFIAMQTPEKQGEPLDLKRIAVQRIEMGSPIVNGEFENPEALHLEISRIFVSKQFVKVHKVKVTRNQKEVFAFDEKQSNDIRIELSSRTALLPKPATISLDCDTIHEISQLVERYSSTLDLLGRIPSGKKSETIQSDHMKLVTASIKIFLESPDCCLRFTIFPISLNESMSLDKVVCELVGDTTQTLLQVHHVKFTPHAKGKTLQTFDKDMRLKKLSTKAHLHIETVDITVELGDIARIVDLCMGVLPKSEKKITTSIIPQSLSLFVDVEKVSFKGRDAIFGELDGQLSTIHCNVYPQSLVHAFVLDCSLNRGEEKIVKRTKTTTTPVVFVKLRNGSNSVDLKNLSIEYYAMWLELLRDESSTRKPSSQEKSRPLQSQPFKVGLNDISLGLNPARLQTKAMVVVERGSAEVSHTGVKCFIKTVSLLVADNDKVFVPVGVVKSLFFGLAFQESIEVKVTSDFCRLEFCADSAQCFMQLLNDLKDPIAVTFDEKYSPIVPADIQVMSHIEENAFAVPGKAADNLHSVESYHKVSSEESNSESNSESDSGSDLEHFETLSIQENHFEEESTKIVKPLIAISLSIGNVSVKLYDGYDWKQTRSSIKKAVSRAEEKALDSVNPVQETLYGSIRLDVPPSTARAELVDSINRSVNASAKRKLELRRSASHKVLIQLTGLDVDVAVHSTDGPSVSSVDPSAEILNSVSLQVSDFEIIDNVPTSTWNRFLTYMREAGDKEIGVGMVRASVTTVRPVRRLAASELIVSVKLLPLSLHVDQDTLDFLTRFGEFRDERLCIADPDDDAAFIQKLTVHPVRVKLDYKPKKVDYVGIRSGHTTEFMNFFILEDAKMTLRKVVLYGISGFPSLSKKLNACWMPDIRSNQLSGVLAGVAPVRSVVQIGAGFKNLVTVPVREYRKDGRVFRSLQKGASVFSRNTANELLKLGVKLAIGTQTLLETAEEALGGSGASFREKDDFSYFFTVQKGLPGETDRQRHVDSSGFGVESVYDFPIVDEEGPKTISLYANQPMDVKEGLSLAYASFGKNLAAARQVLVAAGMRASESGSAQNAALEIAKATPVAFVRPLIGTTEAISRTLQGGVNYFNPDERLNWEEKYKGGSSRNDGDSRKGVP